MEDVLFISIYLLCLSALLLFWNLIGNIIAQFLVKTMHLSFDTEYYIKMFFLTTSYPFLGIGIAYLYYLYGYFCF